MHLNGILSGGMGTVEVAGMRVDPDDRAVLREVRRRVGIVFQDPDDQLFMPSVREDVAFGPANMGLRGAELEARVQHALELVGMAAFADRPPHHLSFGQRRRVAVATVLSMEPEIIVLDEPSSNLDPASRDELADILRSLDVTILMSPTPCSTPSSCARAPWSCPRGPSSPTGRPAPCCATPT
jgi:cobalt/nickel transport system ATP-binding protein